MPTFPDFSNERALIDQGLKGEVTSPVFGSSEDVGYLRSIVFMADGTKVSLMLSSNSRSTFLVCPDSLVVCPDLTPSCHFSAETFNVTFYDAQAEGKYLLNATLCLHRSTDWCSDPSSHAIGCVDSVEGSLKENSEAGVWGLGPGGLHPDVLTLCFGTKRLAGRIIPWLENDAGTTVTNWLNFEKQFTVLSPSGATFVRFLSPESVWDDVTTTNVSSRIDFSSMYSFLPRTLFLQAKKSFMDSCESLGCRGFKDYSDGASLACFRFIPGSEVGMMSDLPDLEWRVADETKILVPPVRYLFTTDDGSKCVGIFEGDEAIVGLNMLSGLRLRVDYANSRLKLDACPLTSTSSISSKPNGDDSALPPTVSQTQSSITSTWSLLFGLVIVFLGIPLALLALVQVRRRASTNKPTRKAKKSFFRASGFLRNQFSSRKQTFKTVRFQEIQEEEMESISDDEETRRNDEESNLVESAMNILEMTPPKSEKVDEALSYKRHGSPRANDQAVVASKVDEEALSSVSDEETIPSEETSETTPFQRT